MVNEQFDIKVTDDVLILKVSSFAIIKKIVIQVIALIIATVISFQFGIQATESNSVLLKLVYFLPLLLLPSLAKQIMKLVNGVEFRFDKQLGDLQHNKSRISLLSEIQTVEINYDSSGESDELHLDLKMQSRSKIRISDTGNKKGLTKAGVSIAKFMKIEFWDNNRYGKELLWGAADVTNSDIESVNDHLKK